MGASTVGSVVLVQFPYFDLSRAKLRPALVIGQAEFNNLILCQITSQSNVTKVFVPLTSTDLSGGVLSKDTSYIRPDKIFTADQRIITKKIGTVSDNIIKEVKSSLSRILDI